eukprot:764763-Hanusia_phi.AAC.2
MLSQLNQVDETRNQESLKNVVDLNHSDLDTSDVIDAIKGDGDGGTVRQEDAIPKRCERKIATSCDFDSW